MHHIICWCCTTICRAGLRWSVAARNNEALRATPPDSGTTLSSRRYIKWAIGSLRRCASEEALKTSCRNARFPSPPVSPHRKTVSHRPASNLSARFPSDQSLSHHDSRADHPLALQRHQVTQGGTHETVPERGLYG